MDNICAVCGRSGRGYLLCSNCKTSRYCSKGCQRVDWTIHKYLCRTFKDFQKKPTSEDGKETFGRAIYFHPEEDGPRFVWLEFRDPTPSGEVSYLSAATESLLSNTDEEIEAGGHQDVDHRKVGMNNLTGRFLPYIIAIAYRVDFLMDGSELNKAISGICNNSPEMLYQFKGPFVALGHERTTGRFQTIVDLKPSDLRTLANYFNKYLSSAVKEKSSTLRIGTKLAASQRYLTLSDRDESSWTIYAVRINCVGDMENNGQNYRYGDKKKDLLPIFETFQVSTNHSMFDDDPLPLSQQIELPLVMAKVPNSWKQYLPRGGKQDGMKAWLNFPAQNLQRVLDTSLDYKQTVDSETGALDTLGFGCPPKEWQRNIGPVIVARKNQQKLLPDHLAALVAYSESLDKAFAKTRKGASKENVLKRLTKQDFLRFWAEWAEENNITTAMPYVT